MRVLVTGGAGYIGSHACKALAQAGHEPIVYDNLSSGHRWAVKWGAFEYGDIADVSRISEVMAVYRPDAVMHFAAHAYVGESVTNPAKYYGNNVGGTLALLGAMIRHGVRKLIFSSTCASYGVPDVVPITEDQPQRPINPYGHSKLMVEQVLRDYASAYGLRATALRYFNAAGADIEGELGEEHEPETHLIPLVLMAAAGMMPDVTIFGEDYETPDGTCVRDYTHVADLAAAHVLALENLSVGEPEFRYYNLGTGSGLSVREIIESVARVTGRQPVIRNGPRRPGDPPSLVADPAKAQAELGWQCQNSSVDQMIGTAWAWMTSSDVAEDR